MNRIAPALLALALIAPVLFARPAPTAPPPAPQFFTEVEGIREYRLPNGLRVLLIPDSSQTNITINVTYLVGSKHEGYGESGMAHLLEHLLFKGTEKFPKITEEIARRGGRANGTTWFDRTNYFQTFPASEENLRWALAMEADRMVNSLLRKEDLDSEMTVVRNEYEAGENSPFGVLLKRLMGAAYQWHGYGRSTIGERSDLENVPIERLRDFYRKYYQPDNAVLILAGRFDEALALKLIAETFGRIPKPNREGEMRLWPTYTREPSQDGERRVEVRRVGDTPLVAVAYHIPAAAHPDAAALVLLADLLDQEPGGRLYRALVSKGLAASVQAIAFQLAEPGLFIAFAQLRADGDAARVEAAMHEVFADIVQNPPSEEELKRAKARALRDFELTLNDVSRIGIGLSEWAAAGDWRLMFLFRDRIEQTTVEDLKRVAASYFKPANRTVGVFRPDPQPDRVAIPEPAPIAEQLAGYVGRPGRARGEDFLATPENIEARLIRAELPHGARLIMLPKSTRGGKVVGRLAMPLAGRAADWLPQREVAEAVAAMLLRGTAKRNRQAIEDQLAEQNAVLSFAQSGQELLARFETTGERLHELLDLLAEVLAEPSFPEEELSTWRNERLAALESARSDPMALASLTLARHMTPVPAGDPRYVPTLEEQIARVSAIEREALAAFHRERYGFSPGSRIVLVGDFDPDFVSKQLAARFERFAAPAPHERLPNEVFAVEAKVLRVEVPDRPNAVLAGALAFPLRDDHPDYPALLLANETLGGGFLNSRLAKRLRQQDGISYGAGSGFSASARDEAASLQLFAIFARENHAKALQAVREELERAVGEGFGAEEVEQAKQGWLQSFEVSLGRDAELAGLLAEHAKLGRDMAYERALVERIRALGADEVSAAFRRHVDPARVSYVLGGDLADAAASAAAAD